MPLEVWKFPLDAMVIEPARQTHVMPAGAKFLSLQWQHGVPVVWAAVDPSAPKELRTFALIKSGRPLDGIDVRNYVGTVQTLGGSPVWHVFEVR